MKLFENITRITNDNYWVRYYDTEEEKSIFEMVSIEDDFFYIDRHQEVLEDKKLDDERFRTLIGNQYLKRQKTKGFTEPYGSYQKHYAYIRDNFWSPKSENYNRKPRGFYLDIETRSTDGFPMPDKADQVITTIQIYDNIEDKYYIIMDKPVSKNFFKDHRMSNYERNTEFIVLEKEKDRILKFCDLIHNNLPLFVTAWNGRGFDYPYLYNRMINIKLNPNLLSPLKKAKLNSKEIKGRVNYDLIADGVFYIDMMDVYKKFILSPRSSYALDFIAEVELKEKKVNHTEYEKFDDFYTGNYKLPYNATEEQMNSSIYKAESKYLETKDEKYRDLVKELSRDEFIYYSIKDVDLLSSIDRVLALTAKMVFISEKMGVKFDDSLGTIKPWATYIANTAFLENKILPKDAPSDTNGTNKGGFVRETIKGKHKWLASSDISSMYPNQIIFGNMSPETYIGINDLPLDLQEIVVKYFNNEEEDERIELSPEIWNKYTSLLQKYNYSGSITGAVFRNDVEGIIPRLVSQLYIDRKAIKKEMLVHQSNAENIQKEINKRKNNKPKSKKYNEYSDDELQKKLVHEELLGDEKDITQHVLKIQMNSLYGAIGNKYMQLYNIEIAKAITGNGRYFIKEMANNIECTLNSVINYKGKPVTVAGDTDSVYFSLEPVVNHYLIKNPNSTKNEIADMLDKFYTKVIDPRAVQKSVTDFGYKLNGKRPEVIASDREVIADSACFFAKKQYIMSVIDNEGVRYSEPHIKMTGVEIKKSSIPPYIKEQFEKCIDILLFKENNDIISFVKESKANMYKQDIYKLAKTTSVTSLDYSLGDKGVPINSRAALVHNKYILDNKLQDKYELIKPGDKIKMIYLNPANPTLNNVIAFIDSRFIEIFKDYIDYDEVYKRFFLNSLSNMTEPLNWSLDTTDSIDEDW